jgi:hypothetical protein
MKFRTRFFPIDLFGLTKLVVQFQHSHPVAAGTFANVGIEGPLEKIDSSGALDLTFACEAVASRDSERQIRSTGIGWPAIVRIMAASSSRQLPGDV